MSVYRIFVTGNPYLALEKCSDVTGGHNCNLKVKIEVNWRSNIKIYCIALTGVLLYGFCVGESISSNRPTVTSEQCFSARFGLSNTKNHEKTLVSPMQ